MTATAAAASATIPDEVPTGVVLRYGVGQLGAQVFRDTPAVLLPLFMTTMLGVPAWLAGLVVLVPKLWLIVCDPLVGAWSDRMKAAIGRTPFLIGGAVGTTLGFIALFAVTSYPSPYIAAAAICALFFLASTAFSIYSVPYLAIAAELSGDPHQRNRIMVLRMFFATLGVLVGVGLAQPVILHFGGGAAGWHAMSWLFGALCLVSMLTTASGLRKVPLIQAGAVAGSLREQLKVVSRNRPFLMLLATSFASNIGQAASYTVIGFVFLYVVQAIWLIPVFILCMSAASLAAQPLWLWLPRRIGKPRAYVLASVIWAAVTVTWLWVGKGGADVATLPGGQPVNTEHLLILLRAVVIGSVNGGFILLALSMMTDTVDYQRRTQGVANEGVFAGLFSAMEKLAFALGPVIAGIVMSAFGFVSSTGGAAAQSASAITGIVLLYSAIPAALQLAALAIFSRYRLPATS
ncbi:MFS transporter [Novosphingobium taihuense]|uniref:GPH family glycoside/pentoside/hexuronide:cation symporter n=1 Tax=Novosphingobium taihuense TaxID=260085 RepID=A0A7W7AD58_9SPHN|nr:MFS transporter [Novosphingobium taihuense]MBB4614797.1 GPH family glycoside/pentoside/hexuronide:cation symporter [Novosphingobium taihuense]TWH84761.1 GPH family glycoside/pentoside/hexuronide:cation symporter [Novosphingobium taihuense]